MTEIIEGKYKFDLKKINENYLKGVGGEYITQHQENHRKTFIKNYGSEEIYISEQDLKSYKKVKEAFYKCCYVEERVK